MCKGAMKKDVEDTEVDVQWKPVNLWPDDDEDEENERHIYDSGFLGSNGCYSCTGVSVDAESDLGVVESWCELRFQVICAVHTVME